MPTQNSEIISSSVFFLGGGGRLSREIIDEIFRREEMIECLSEILADPYNWNEPLPAWWMPVHAIYALV